MDILANPQILNHRKECEIGQLHGREMTGLVKHNKNVWERKYVSDSLPFEEHLDYRPALILHKICNSQNNEVQNIAYVSVLSLEETVICIF